MKESNPHWRIWSP